MPSDLPYSAQVHYFPGTDIIRRIVKDFGGLKVEKKNADQDKLDNILYYTASFFSEGIFMDQLGNINNYVRNKVGGQVGLFR